MLATADVAHGVWEVKSVKFVNDCSSRVFVIGVGWVEPNVPTVVNPGSGIMPFVNDRISVSYEELTLVGLDRHMNVLEMNDGHIRDTGSAFELNEPHPNLMGYWGWYNINMEVTTWKDDHSPFCTEGHGGARTILDFTQCSANGGKILSEGPGKVCAKQDGTHIFCGADQSSPLYNLMLHSTAGWQSDKTWISDADTTAPLSSFLCDPQTEQPPRGVGFMIGCEPASNEMGVFQVRFCPSSSDVLV